MNERPNINGKRHMSIRNQKNIRRGLNETMRRHDMSTADGLFGNDDMATLGLQGIEKDDK